MGFLSNGDDEKGLAGAVSSTIVEAIVATVNELRSGVPAAAQAPAPAVK